MHGKKRREIFRNLTKGDIRFGVQFESQQSSHTNRILWKKKTLFEK